MGRERWWTGGSFLAFWLVLVLLHVPKIRAEGEVGCLFDSNVCKSEDETCWDDAAFGKCIRLFDANDDDTYRYDLNPIELALLREKLENLVDNKYDWLHPYTQCIMQNTLYSIKNQQQYDNSYCREFENSGNYETTDFINVDNEDLQNEGISPLAVINFAPSRGHGYGDYANEMYYPPESSISSEEKNEEIFIPFIDENIKPTRHPTLNFNNKKKIYSSKKKNYYHDNTDLNDDLDDGKYDDELYELTKKFQRVSDDIKNLKIQKKDDTTFRLRREPKMDNDDFDFDNFGKDITRYLDIQKSTVNDDEEDGDDDDNYRDKIESKKINNTFDEKTILDFVNGGKLNKNEKNKMWIINDEDDDDDDESEYQDEDIDVNLFDPENDLSSGTDDPSWDELQAFFSSRGISGFKRPERLDVKKPGPQFSQNNYAFDLKPDKNSGDDNELQNNKRSHHDRLVKKEMIAGRDITLLSPSETYRNNVDMDYVYVQFDKSIHNWRGGEGIVEQMGKILGLDPWDLSDVRVGNAEVTFKVNDNSRKLNATDIAKDIFAIRDKVGKAVNINPIGAGVGDKIKLPPIWQVSTKAQEQMDEKLFSIIVAAGGAAVVTAAVVILFLARKHARIRAKLASLSTPDPEASKDYQELCRARMQAKQAPEKIESPRITSLSRESESSNRSSTSSWGGEEAAALANMDISTGRVVLSYMEDHLKNKDRLDQEWSAVCAYEPEPSSIAIASDKKNSDRNRPGSAPTYDHSRVILNDLTNANNSDYINASTITDHDPRNPAYIATQGPLPQTSADFWQLVWEQGSVVIVMLTRLTEEGKAMCHRYWPEEGSELYHIYEVHLVSEHIWCDDYLVRSFYLKNLRTGETRTVTQFHFLSWSENSVPTSTKSLLEFRRKINKSYRGRSCPIVVHCSDGAGRTGTYCLIDMVLNRMMKGAKEIDIAAALEHIRDQRPHMVSTKKQFEFVLVAVAEEVHAILKVLPTQSNDKTTLATNPSTSSNPDK